ncbi:glycosyltransferase family 2 protein [Streptomyces liangshanensis]|uniref:Glycosyltransferase n=1 Tax=Streptomyces liangshanensis TaxID=2717324 RepID=A0A6G9GY61_9ACTN|nr:glycosyltransferase family 2 protein [Streptomyces liangshanensis]QIQ03165.1 glycosyltransferase [Streptomyces liangshanensis]
MAVRVTVVVPTYNSGTVLEPLVGSLLRQTMPPEAFEVLFVDDGSTDDTPARLAALAAEHPNFRLTGIPNSGWPGRPRNVAIDLARGEYVQFVDHDDLLGDEALTRMYDLGRANGSDIVIGKVVSTFRSRGIPHALMSRTRASCTFETAPLHDSLTVHKMYRTAFLREQGIRFPVGHFVGEDLLFIVPAVFRAASVSVVGDYPCYYYLEREGGGHTTPDHLDPVSYAGNLRRIFDALGAETPPGPVRDKWLRRFWRADMVKYLSEPVFATYGPEARVALFGALREVAEEYLTEGVYEGLAGLERARAALVRTGRPDALLELTGRAAGLGADVRLTSVEWRRGRVRARFDARFVTGGTGPEAPRTPLAPLTPLTLVRRGERYLLDPSLTDGLVEPVDVTDDLKLFRADVSLRHRDTSVVWLLPREVSVSFEETPAHLDGDVLVRPVVHGTVAVDPARAAGGGPLDDGVWEVHVRLMGPGLDRYGRPRGGPEDLTLPAPAVLGGLETACHLDGGLALTVRPTDTAPAPRPPKVTVVVPTGGAEPAAVRDTLASLTAQTLPAAEFEVLQVPEAARPGGPGEPGTGEYLLYMRAGDRLAADALERLYGYGIAHDADIVVGRRAAKGRAVPRELFSRDRPRATFAKDPLADSLTADKLFHRAFLAEHGLRFPAAGVPLGEHAFTAEASLRAGRTAVLGGAVCYHSGPERDTPAVPYAALYGALRTLVGTVNGLTTPGGTRDRLHRRWLRVELLDPLMGRGFPERDEDDRRALCDAIRDVFLNSGDGGGDSGLSDTAIAALTAPRRVAVGLVTDNRLDDLVALVRWETSVVCRARLDEVSWQRDGALRTAFTAELRTADGPLGTTSPDEGDDDPPTLTSPGLSAALSARFARAPLTGGAAPGRASAVLVLRERAGGAEYRLATDATVHHADGTLTVAGSALLDPATAAGGAPLRDGAWDLYVRLTALGWTKTARLGSYRAPEVSATPPPPVPHPTTPDRRVTPYWTTPHRDLTLRVAPPPPTERAPGRLTRLIRRLRRG